MCLGEGKGTTWIACQKQNALHKGTQGSNKDHSGEGKPKDRRKEKGEVQLKGNIPIQDIIVGKETTKVVREVTMPMRAG